MIALDGKPENKDDDTQNYGGHFERSRYGVLAELPTGHWPNHQKYKRNQNGAVSTNPATIPVMMRFVSPVIAMVFFLQGID